MPGFKELRVENWRRADRTSSLFFRPASESPENDGGDRWAELLLQPRLSERVPSEVRDLFEVARGAMLYGFLFYPLYTLGSEQLFRVFEAALKHKCKLAKAPPELCGFRAMQKWLEARGHLAEPRRWDAVREIRNETSHPERQFLVTPHQALRDLETSVGLIDSLFQMSSPCTEDE
jgi:hypothetical protein